MRFKIGGETGQFVAGVNGGGAFGGGGEPVDGLVQTLKTYEDAI